MTARFTHITFNVANYGRSIAFYRDVCDMDVVRDRRLEGGSTVWMGPRGSNVDAPSYVFVLVEGEVSSKLDHLAFQCDQREEVTAKAALGASLNLLHTGPIDEGGSVGYYTMLHDPDGHLVEFTFGQPIRGVQ